MMAGPDEIGAGRPSVPLSSSALWNPAYERNPEKREIPPTRGIPKSGTSRSKKGAGAKAAILLNLDRPSPWDLEEDLGLVGPFYKQYAPRNPVEKIQHRDTEGKETHRGK